MQSSAPDNEGPNFQPVLDTFYQTDYREQQDRVPVALMIAPNIPRCEARRISKRQ